MSSMPEKDILKTEESEFDKIISDEKAVAETEVYEDASGSRETAETVAGADTVISREEIPGGKAAGVLGTLRTGGRHVKKWSLLAGRRTKEIIRLGVNQFCDPYYQGVAPQIAFFLFLSVVPTIILVSRLLGFFSLSIDQIQAWADITITGDGTGQLEALLKNGEGSGGTLVSTIILIATALWASSRAHFSMVRVTNYTLTDGDNTGGSWLRERARSMITMAMMLLTLVVGLVLLIYFPTIMKLIFPKMYSDSIMNRIWYFMRWPIFAALYFLMISVVYYYLPTKKLPYRRIIPGSIFASIGFLIVSFGYNIYAKVSISNNVLYGSLSSVVMLIFWFWCIAWVLLLGLTFSRVWWATSSKNPLPISEEALSRRKPINVI